MNTRLERLLQINVAALAALGTILLSMGQNGSGLPLFVMAAAVTSIIVTDIKDWFHLNKTVANITALVAGAFALSHLRSAFHAVPLLAIAQFLVSLQVILLFQKKEVRQYWQLCALSFLQVVVAAVFNQGVLFGVLLGGYLFIGISTLALFYLYREEQAGRRPDETPRTDPEAEEEPPRRRWPLASAEAVVVGQAARSRGRQGLGWDLYKRLGAFSVGTLILTGCIFFIIPRLGRTAWRGPMLVERKTVGFTDEVELGELGATVENPEEVGRVTLIDETTGETIRPPGGLYLHGAVLMTYEKGRWTEPFSWKDPQLGVRKSPRTTSEGVTRQQIMLEPLDQNEIFHIRPAYAPKLPDDIPEDDGPRERNIPVMEDEHREKLLRPMEQMKIRYEVELLTTAFREERQTSWIPAINEFGRSDVLQIPAGSHGADGLPWLRKTAANWLAKAKIPDDDPVRVARFLEHKFRDSGLYKYSLEGATRDPNVDPIEDFVVNNRSGNCEYFATALALMLRTRGIPSRVIVGYKTDEWNQVGGFFQIRQLHAHTWVEAHIPADRIPKDVFLTYPEWDRGCPGWLRLDPTTGNGADAASTGGIFAPLDSLLDRMEFLWDNYVMEMDHRRQSRAIYQPVREWINDAYERVSDPDWWAAVGRKAKETLNPANWNVQQWFSWRGGAVAVVVCFLCVGAYYAIRAIRRWTARILLRRRRARRAAAKAAQVEFYRRFEVLLARRRLAREATMTHREFAARIAEWLESRPECADAVPLVSELTEAFYRVRFAHRRLKPEERERIEEVLGRLERAVAPTTA